MTFFGFQLACRAQPLGHLRGELARIVRSHGRAVSTQDMRALWSQAAPALLECVPAAVSGSWDLVRGRGEAEYEEWISGLEAMAGWEPADFGAPVPQEAMVLISAVFLVAADSNADALLGDRCDLPESRWSTRETWRRLVATPPMLNLTGVRGCGLYLAPGEVARGFAPEVLRSEGFAYLRPVTG